LRKNRRATGVETCSILPEKIAGMRDRRRGLNPSGKKRTRSFQRREVRTYGSNDAVIIQIIEKWISDGREGKAREGSSGGEAEWLT